MFVISHVDGTLTCTKQGVRYMQVVKRAGVRGAFSARSSTGSRLTVGQLTRWSKCWARTARVLRAGRTRKTSTPRSRLRVCLRAPAPTMYGVASSTMTVKFTRVRQYYLSIATQHELRHRPRLGVAVQAREGLVIGSPVPFPFFRASYDISSRMHHLRHPPNKCIHISDSRNGCFLAYGLRAAVDKM